MDRTTRLCQEQQIVAERMLAQKGLTIWINHKQISKGGNIAFTYQAPNKQSPYYNKIIRGTVQISSIYPTLSPTIVFNPVVPHINVNN
jgi:ubiquitin-protein ligase